uniref:Uncharacterized protein n=1 Tax=viral metagenome TaxID=1070528 RepID=A0A6M3IH00_9ZZZZ
MTTKNQMMKNVRLFCSECMGGPRASTAKGPIPNPSDVDGCTAPDCIWFPFRMGDDPAKDPKRAARMRRIMAERKQGLENNGQGSTNAP